jgi:hypothetical protein
VGQARDLYTRTAFSGCIALLSITEQELGRNIVDASPLLEERAHRLLAEVNLWLGVCQWAAGDPQTAAASFVRSALHPRRPRPDPALLPPALVEAYRRAVDAPRHEETCEVEAPLKTEHLQVDGQPIRIPGNTFRVAAGTHYLTMKVTCSDASAECASTRRQVGLEGTRSLRLEAGPARCRVQIPSAPPAAGLTCASPNEAEEAGFVARVTEEAGVAGALVVSTAKGRLALHLHWRGSAAFARQLVSQLEPGETPAHVVGRSIDLLLGGEAPTRPPARPWIDNWWLWTIVGVAVAATTVTAVLAAGSTRPREYRVVFGP